jgi:hypothetical protein
MNETYWEQAKRAHKKRLLLAIFVGSSVLIASAIIICNNEDLLSGRKDLPQESSVADSSLVFFGMPESTETENLINITDATLKPGVDAHSLKKNSTDFSLESGSKLEEKVNEEKKNIEKIAPAIVKNDNNEPGRAQYGKAKTITELQYSKEIDKETKNIDSSQQYSILLPNIKISVINRKDIIILMALELFYRDSTDNSEILIKRDALRIVAIKLVQMKELNAIKKESLSEELKKEMNLIFDRNPLVKVTIREFHIEKVATQ